MINSTLLTWWSFIKTDAQLAGENLKPDDVVLSYSGNGASIMVTVQDIDDFCEELRILKMSALIYEDDLPDNVPQDVYDAWCMMSSVIDGVRMGPRLPLSLYPLKQWETDDEGS